MKCFSHLFNWQAASNGSRWIGQLYCSMQSNLTISNSPWFNCHLMLTQLFQNPAIPNFFSCPVELWKKARVDCSSNSFRPVKLMYRLPRGLWLCLVLWGSGLVFQNHLMCYQGLVHVFVLIADPLIHLNLTRNKQNFCSALSIAMQQFAQCNNSIIRNKMAPEFHHSPGLV